MMEAISVQGLSFSYSGGRPVLKNISFNVEAGETFVIAGLSGSGKTTLCNILAGIIPHSINGDLTGHTQIFGESGNTENHCTADRTRTPGDSGNTETTNTKDHSQTPGESGKSKINTMTGLVFQDSDAQIICTTVEDELAFGLENLCMPPDEIRRRVDETAATFGLTDMLLQNPSKLSGGQKRVMMIAAVLMTEPRILILDEPMNSLDQDGRALVRNCIDRLRDEGRTVLIVEHELESVTFADRWLIIEDGEIAALDTPESLLRDREKLRAMGLIV